MLAFDGVDLREQGFAKPSKRRGRGGGAAALGYRGGTAMVEEMVAAALRGEGWRRLGLEGKVWGAGWPMWAIVWCGWPKWPAAPLWSMWAPYFRWVPLLDSSRTF